MFQTISNKTQNLSNSILKIRLCNTYFLLGSPQIQFTDSISIFTKLNRSLYCRNLYRVHNIKVLMLED